MASSPFSVRRFQIIFIIAWLILMVDHALLLYQFDFPLGVSILDSVISNIPLLGICLMSMITVRYYRPGRSDYLNMVAMCAMLTIIWLLFIKWLLALSFGGYDSYRPFLQHSLVIRFSIAFLVLGIVTLIGLNWYASQDQQQNEERKTHAEALAREAELFKLRQQLQPHFLFNSLNSINALIGSRPVEARKMVQQLSDFLRGTIKKEETQWVSFQEEMQYLQLYLDIEKVRFGNRLATVLDCQDGTAKMKLPALLLQPIVENAIKFGLYDTVGETVIRLEASSINNELLVRVSNPFDPETSSPRQGTGFGLKSVQRRLYLLFGRADLLATEVKDDIFTTIIKVPQLADPGANEAGGIIS